MYYCADFKINNKKKKCPKKNYIFIKKITLKGWSIFIYLANKIILKMMYSLESING